MASRYPCPRDSTFRRCLTCLRQVDVIEIYLIHRLEEDVLRFLRDPSNFEYESLFQAETETA